MPDASLLFSHLSSSSILLPIIFSVMRWPHLRNPVTRLLAVLILISFLSDILSLYLLINRLSNGAVVQIYFVTQFVLLSLIYAVLVPSLNKVIFFVTVGVLFYFIYCSFYIGFTPEAQGYNTTVHTVVLIIYVIAYVTHLNNTIPTTTILWYTPFWINTAVLFYYGFNVFLFISNNDAFSNYSGSGLKLFWMYHNGNNIIKNVLLAMAIYCSNRRHMTPEEMARVELRDKIRQK
jgi:hypothetical protein